MYRKYGEPHEGITIGMVRAYIAHVKEGGQEINVFVRSITARCGVCDVEFIVSETSDTRIRCAKHRALGK